MKRFAFAFPATSLAAFARKKEKSPDYWAVEDALVAFALPEK